MQPITDTKLLAIAPDGSPLRSCLIDWIIAVLFGIALACAIFFNL